MAADPKLPAAAIFVLTLSLLLLNLSHPMIYILDEAKNAECAREMLSSGNYLVPYFNGELRTDKPPLHYFFMVLSFKMFGVSAFAARFFSAVAGALTVLITFLFSRRVLGVKTAFFSALVLLSSLHFNFQMRLAVPDPYLIFFLTASFMCFYLFVQTSKSSWLWLMYLSLGLAFLTKGPVALAIGGLVMFLFTAFTGRLSWQWLRKFNIPLGSTLVFAVALPWYWLNYRATNGEWTEGFFLKHNLQRFTDTMEGHRGFFLLPLIMVVLGLLPFGIFSFQAFNEGRKRKESELLFYSFLIVLVIIVFFSLSKTMLPNYSAPAYPFAAVLLGSFLSGLREQKLNDRWLRMAFAAYSLIAVSIPAGIYFVFRADQDMRQYTYLALFFTALPIGAALGWLFLLKRKSVLFIASIAGSFLLTNVLFFAKAYPAVYAENPVSASLGFVNRQSKLVGYKLMNPAFVFNLQRIIPGFESPGDLKKYLETNPDALIISRKKYQPEVDSLGLQVVFEQRDTFEKPVTVIYRKRKN